MTWDQGENQEGNGRWDYNDVNANEVFDILSDQYELFDDYGLDNPWKGVKEAIDDYLFFPNFKIIKEIGEPKGSDCNPRVNLKEVEGLICTWTNE